MNYAKARFIFGLGVTAIYWPLSALALSPQVHTEDEQGKSFIMFITLAALTLVRDRYEKISSAKREDVQN